MSNFQISIIVPVYNKERYVEKCLHSLCNQSYSNIEIICVDDASTDNSAQIIKKYMSLDRRIKGIFLINNTGTLYARKKGIESCSGKYVMFVDADDWLELNACEMLYAEMEKRNIDILQFGTNVIPANTISVEMLQWIENFLKPCNSRFNGIQILEKCFLDNKFDFNITDKIWNGNLCRKVFLELEQIKLIASEDRYIFFILAYYAKSYEGLNDAKFYNYNVGIGITGNDGLNLYQFDKRCSGIEASNAVRRFLNKVNTYDQYLEIFTEFHKKILWDCVDCWYKKLSIKDQAKGYEILKKYWSAEDIVSAISSMYFEDNIEINRAINNCKKNVGIYYRYFGYTPMNDYVTSLASSLQKSGKNIIYISDDDIDVSIVQFLPLILLPESKNSNWDKYENRCREFASAIKKYKIDYIIYISETSHIAWLDKLLIESIGVGFIYMPEEYEKKMIEQFENTVQQNLLLKDENRLLNENMKKMKNSLTFKVGNTVLYIPRKIKELLRR